MASFRKGIIAAVVIGAALVSSACTKTEDTDYFTVNLYEGWRVVEDQGVFNQAKTSYVFGYYPQDRNSGIKVSVSVDNADGSSTPEMAMEIAKLVRMSGTYAAVSNEGNNIYSIRMRQERPSGEIMYSKCYMRSNKKKVGSICLSAPKEDLTEAIYFVEGFEDFEEEIMPLPLPQKKQK